MPFLPELVQQVEQGGHLGAVLLGVLRVHQAGMAANLAQAHEALKNGKAVLLHGFV